MRQRNAFNTVQAATVLILALTRRSGMDSEVLAWNGFAIACTLVAIVLRNWR